MNCDLCDSRVLCEILGFFCFIILTVTEGHPRKLINFNGSLTIFPISLSVKFIAPLKSSSKISISVNSIRNFSKLPVRLVIFVAIDENPLDVMYRPPTSKKLCNCEQFFDNFVITSSSNWFTPSRDIDFKLVKDDSPSSATLREFRIRMVFQNSYGEIAQSRRFNFSRLIKFSQILRTT